MVPFSLRQERSLMLWEEDTGWLFIRVLLFLDEHKMDSVLIMVNIKCNTPPMWWRQWFWVGMKMKIHPFLTNALNISWVTCKISVPQCIYSVRMGLVGFACFSHWLWNSIPFVYCHKLSGSQWYLVFTLEVFNYIMLNVYFWLNIRFCHSNLTFYISVLQIFKHHHILS